VTRHSWFTETEVFLLHEIVARLDRLARRRVLDAAGLTYAEFVLAMAVNEMERPTQGEVGELLDMSKSLVSQRVGGLLAKGFLVQQRDAENRRQVRLDLTTTGRRALETVYEQLAGNAARIFDALGPSRPQFLQSLRRLRDAVAAVEETLEGGKPPTLR
jgi:DNA-binding MarR family transcriptional regulator